MESRCNINIDSSSKDHGMGSPCNSEESPFLFGWVMTHEVGKNFSIQILSQVVGLK